MHSLLLYISLSSSHNFDVKLPNFSFYVKRELKNDFSFSFSNLRNRPLEFNSRKNLSTFGKSERAGIVLTSTNVHPTMLICVKCHIHFLCKIQSLQNLEEPLHPTQLVRKYVFKNRFLSRRSYRFQLLAAILAGNRISNRVIRESRFFIRSVPEFWKKIISGR